MAHSLIDCVITKLFFSPWKADKNLEAKLAMAMLEFARKTSRKLRFFSLTLKGKKLHKCSFLFKYFEYMHLFRVSPYFGEAVFLRSEAHKTFKDSPEQRENVKKCCCEAQRVSLLWGVEKVARGFTSRWVRWSSTFDAILKWTRTTSWENMSLTRSIFSYTKSHANSR